MSACRRLRGRGAAKRQALGRWVILSWSVGAPAREREHHVLLELGLGALLDAGCPAASAASSLRFARGHIVDVLLPAVSGPGGRRVSRDSMQATSSLSHKA
jgi:hypothetical protein